MNLTGKVLGHGIALTAAGAPTYYQMVIPDKGNGNIKTLAQESKRWRTTAKEFEQLARQGKIDQAVANRAEFADDVLAVAAELVRTGGTGIIIAQDRAGRIIGVMNIGQVSPNEKTINLLAADPSHLTGAPNPESYIRGVGLALVAVASQVFLKEGGQVVYLHPLDDVARRFWISRGFSPNGQGGRLSVRGRDNIQALIGSCTQDPNCAEGDCLVCGLSQLVEMMRSPVRR